MRTRILIASILVLPAFLIAGDKYQRLNVKTGLWEVTRTQTSEGQMPIPAGMLAKLTPEQRARMEARMKEHSGAQTRTTTYKSCVTKEELDKGDAFGGEEKEACTETIESSTSTRAQVKLVCSMQGISGEGTFEIEALSPESTKGSTHITSTGGGRMMTVNSTFTAKWLGTGCGDVQ
jgi:hypothetical protein